MNRWTGILGNVAEKCGDAVAEKLRAQYAGTQILIAKKRENSAILQLFTEDEAARLIEHFGGERIYIPVTGDRDTLKDKIDVIEEHLSKGLTVGQIATMLGVCEQRIYQVRRDLELPKISQRVHPRQLPLFPSD